MTGSRAPMPNVEIAATFDEIADLLEIKGENPFRVRAYRNAARTVQDLATEIETLLRQEVELTRLPGIGKDLATQIRELATTGVSPKLQALRSEIPAGVTELLRLPGLGPKRVKLLMDHLGVKCVDDLKAAAASGAIRELPGFGPKTEEHILQALQGEAKTGERLLLADADRQACTIVAHLRAMRGVTHAEAAGSLRRGKETIGDLDIVVTASDPVEVMQRFVALPDVARVVSHGETRATVVLRSGLQVDVRVVAHESLGAALHYFTGSKAHNVAVRRLAQQRGLKINEYGVFRGDERIAGETEESVFAAVGLPWIAPELREERGEIEAARDGTLPDLVKLGDLRGDLHSHTTASDGRNTLQKMAEAARAMGLEYLAVTEHSQRLAIANGLDEKRLRQHMEEIDRVNATLHGIVLLKGIEVDILEDGSLDLPNAVLAELDIVVCALHSRFKLDRGKQTERLLRALDHPCIHILAHPSGRLIDRRDPCDFDMERVIAAARARGCALELNAHPDRMDLDDVHCRMAKEAGVLVSINSDAHATRDFDNLRYAVGQARRGWLTAADVLNTKPLEQLRRWLAKVRAH